MAVAVVKGRDTLLMKGYGMADIENQVPVTPQTVFRIGSVTKQFTSAAVMQLVEAEKVSLDDDMSKYIPKYPTRGKQDSRAASAQSHLGHSELYRRRSRIRHRDAAPTSATIRSSRSSRPIRCMFEPGAHFYYNNTGYFMLGMLIEQVAGKPYGTYLEEKLFAPNGLASHDLLRHAAHHPERAHGYDRAPTGLVNASFLSMDLPYAAGSLCSTVVISWRGPTSSRSGKIVIPGVVQADDDADPADEQAADELRLRVELGHARMAGA